MAPEPDHAKDRGSCKLAIARTAVFIDGGFISAEVKKVLGKTRDGKEPRIKLADFARALGREAGNDVFRISYYDCPPLLRPEDELTPEEIKEQRERQQKKIVFTEL